MKTFVIHTLGCKVNQYESRQLDQWLRHCGLSAAEDGSRTDLVIINTCCVTQSASAKSRQAVRKARKQNPHAAILLTGCLPAGPQEESAGFPKNTTVVSKKDQLKDIIHSLLTKNNRHTPVLRSKPPLTDKIKRKNGSGAQDLKILDPFGPLRSYSGQTRAFLKIQDGCDARCTYCIIPTTRPTLWSKPLHIILDEARSLVASGHREIVLTGIFLGAWGRDTARRKQWDPAQPGRLPDLLRRLSQIPGLVRLRLSSLEPADLTDELIKVYQECPNLAPHLHLPLQSGSPRILKRMARQYTADEYLQICEKLQEALDRPAITTDVMVGFPGETDEDYEKTLTICRRLNFAKIHVFPFSPRSGTAAARLRPVVPSTVIRQRADQLQQLDKQLQKKFRKQFIGEKVQVIIEDAQPPRGRCERYFMVDCSREAQSRPLLPGQTLHKILDK